MTDVGDPLDAEVLAEVRTGVRAEARPEHHASAPPRRRGRRRAAAGGIVAALFLLSCFVLFLVSLREARQQVAPDRRGIGAAPADLRPWLQDAVLHTADGLELRGWYGAGRRPSAVVLLHAYGGNRRSLLDRARLYHDAGLAVLLYDARASGESEGDRRTVGYHEVEDLLAATRFLEERGVHEIACDGWSQGAATILMAAERLPSSVRCVVLESAFDSLEHSVDRAFRKRVHLPGAVAGVFFRPLYEHCLGVSEAQFRPIDHAPSLRCPALVMSGSEDRSTWAADTRALFDALPEPKELWLVEGADHQDLERYAPEEFARRVLAFLNSHLP